MYRIPYITVSTEKTILFRQISCGSCPIHTGYTVIQTEVTHPGIASRFFFCPFVLLIAALGPGRSAKNTWFCVLRRTIGEGSKAHNCGNESSTAFIILHVMTAQYVRARCESPGSHILLLATCAAHAMDDYCVILLLSKYSLALTIVISQRGRVYDGG